MTDKENRIVLDKGLSALSQLQKLYERTNFHAEKVKDTYRDEILEAGKQLSNSAYGRYNWKSKYKIGNGVAINGCVRFFPDRHHTVWKLTGNILKQDSITAFTPNEQSVKRLVKKLSNGTSVFLFT